MTWSNSYIFGFSAAVCVVCSVAVSGAAVSLKDRQDLNKERDLHSNILQALDLIAEGQAVTGPEIDTLWYERVELALFTGGGDPVAADDADYDLDDDGDVDIDDAGLARSAVKGTDGVPSLLGLYKRVDEGQVKAWAVPVHGKGLWGPLSGYIALDAGLSEVTGVTFFAPKETPGLGAEIMETPFEAQFKGKKVVGNNGDIAAIQVAKGAAANTHADAIDHWVDGVSGATITCRGVSAMMVQGFEKHYAATLQRLRNG